MTWGTFFNSRPFKYGAAAGTAGLLAGVGSTVVFSLHFASECAHAIHSITSQIDTTFKIATLSAELNIADHTTTITLHNIEADIPPEVMSMIDEVNQQMPSYCLNIPLTIGMCLTVLVAISLASSAFAISSYQQQKQEEKDSEYSLLTM